MASDFEVQLIKTEEELRYTTQVTDGPQLVMILGTQMMAKYYVANWDIVVLVLFVIMLIMVRDIAATFCTSIHFVTVGKVISGIVQQSTLDGILVAVIVMMWASIATSDYEVIKAITYAPKISNTVFLERRFLMVKPIT
jgi:hypothetical protein